MNYLAHLFLAPADPLALVGNLAGDFVEGRLEGHWTGALRAGIEQHRRIDAYTDSHPEVAAFRRVLIPEHRHYSRVISDVFFDHFLATEWKRYSSGTLEEFIDRTFATLDAHQDVFPDSLKYVYPRMKAWLLSYREIDGIETALRNMSRRLSRKPHMETAVNFLRDRDARAELLRRFEAFFPDVIAFAKTL